ncbi:nucleoside/nucleotide kinase family protein [Photobacterium gaetbulicola]|uniref:Putative fructose transport system kinase n=1 Tax=Photobacterium gaetbulicola Gung47 TaxID=658445 RepID=A0A0C5WFU8_9GAMM|nr:nucleoside/nucleotide kinase family protein [Photobacterium gaetbulicola]AJR05062.1 putative fructose transport system kinase [Photobacterium gaetbulicola Gung47]PSU06908.1 nucleoside/nucleotide kinase family protein [Photobacterium gaetbulicola]
MKVNLNISGFDTEAVFPDKDIKTIHKPLVEKFTRLYQETQQRIVIFLSAPPGSGKSTLAAFWEYLSEQDEHLEPLQVLPFDGFHYPNDILDSNTTERNGETISLRSIKGSYETFNLTELIDKLKQLKVKDPKWPYYDRNLHDPVDDAIDVTRNIVVVEGNWLLLDEPVWQGLYNLADFTVFIDTQPEFLQERLVNRKIRGGSSPEEALAFYQKSDAVNVEKVLNHSIKADLNLFMNRDGSFEIQ